MRNLEDFIYESYIIDEGEIWNNIKYNITQKINKWIDRLFNNDENEDALEDKMNTISKKYSESSSEEFEKYAEETFDIKKCTVKMVGKKNLENLFTNLIKPDYDNKRGFYEFDLTNINFEKSNILMIFNVISKGTRQPLFIPVATIELDKELFGEKVFNISKLQILSEYSKIFKMSDAINLLFNSNLNITKIYVEKKTNKDLYNKLINDCDFVKETDDESNQIAMKINDIKQEKK